MEKKILLGVTSSIAAYRSHDLVRLFVKAGYDVHVIVTRHALEFVTPMTLATLSGNPVQTDEALWNDHRMAHIDMKDQASLLVIAPATANIIGKCASGIADDLLSTTYISVTCPVVLAPAMNPNMYRHPAVQHNMEILKQRGVHVVEPDEGDVVCGDEGQGRLAPVEDIFNRSVEVLGNA